MDFGGIRAGGLEEGFAVLEGGSLILMLVSSDMPFASWAKRPRRVWVLRTGRNALEELWGGDGGLRTGRSALEELWGGDGVSESRRSALEKVKETVVGWMAVCELGEAPSKNTRKFWERISGTDGGTRLGQTPS
jgi:hypothetical protein